MSLKKFIHECEKISGKYLKLLETPPKEIKSDLALPCFSLVKIFKKNPVEISFELEKKFCEKKFSLIKKIKSQGPYVNFYADWEKLGKFIIKNSMKKKYSKGNYKEKIIVEYSSPNTNKPLHVGHLRNDSIGMAVSNILEFMGNKVLRTEIINDRGVHICKSMLAYKKWGKEKLPTKKSDHFVGDFYVLFEKRKTPELENEIKKLLIKWEKGDKKTISLWKKMNKWVLDGMKETYKTFGSYFDFVTFESKIYKKAKPILDEGRRRKIFTENEKGDLEAKLKPELPDKTVLRKNGTSVYVTQDLALAKIRFEKYKPDKIIYVVATEQNLHFKQLFSILSKLGYKMNLHHLKYGLVNLPSGRMKTREGNVIDADELITELKNLASKEIQKRENPDKKIIEERSLKIALASIKYFMLKIEPQKDILFDIKKAISFEGDSGPYLQYTYARCFSILKKSKKKPSVKKFSEKEIELIKKISQFPELVKKSATELKPNYIANYLSELCAIFNTYYHENKIIDSKNEEHGLSIVNSVKNVLGIGLKLLGITPLERM